DDIAEGQRLAQRLWAGEIPMYTRAKRTIRKDGKIIWLALTCSLVRKSDGAPDYVITFAQDISKEKQAEAALADSNAMLDSVIETLPAMVFLKRASDLAFVRFNRAGEKLLGYSRDCYIGKNDYDFFPKEQADFFIKVDREVLATAELREIEEEPI